MRGDEFYDKSDVNHRENGSCADDIPQPTSEKEIAAANGKEDEGRVYTDFDFCERTVRHLTDDD